MDKEQQPKSSELITDVVVGVSDGLTIPFVLATGLSAVIENTTTIIIVGLVATVIGAIAMAIGGYAAGKPAGTHQHDEAHTLLGLSKETQVLIDDEIAKDKTTLDNYIKEYGLDIPTSQAARNTALTIGLSYAVAGLIPLSPYFFVMTPADGLKISVLLSACSLFLFGYFKGKFLGQNAVATAFRLMLIGCVAATGAYLIAGIFR